MGNVQEPVLILISAVNATFFSNLLGVGSNQVAFYKRMQKSMDLIGMGCLIMHYLFKT